MTKPNIIYKVRTAIGIIKTIKNFHVYFLDHFNLRSQEYSDYILRNGLKFRVRSKTADRVVINEMWVQRYYNPKGFEIGRDDVIVDIGAHIGVFSIFASSYAKKGMVYAFEPVPANIEVMEYNVSINENKNIKVIEKAVSDRTGEQEMFLSVEDTSGHSLNPIQGKVVKKIVKTISLQDFIGENNIQMINFLEMDCEGAENNILSPLPNEVFGRIERISMEVHEIDEKHNIQSLKKLLEEKGFEVKTDSRICKMLYARNIMRQHTTANEL